MGFFQKFRPRQVLKTTQFSQALEAEQREAIAEQLLSSPFLKTNVLNERFSSTEGFSIVFQRPEQALEHFSTLGPFIELLNDLDTTNLYYLNILVIGQQGHVDRHVDHSIRGYDQRLPLPTRVSVLYVQVPEMIGGRLLFYARNLSESASIVPYEGLLVHFDGRLKHAVEAVNVSAGLRVSLVCEQYCLRPSQLEKVPDFSIKSTASFFTYLNGMGTESV